MKKGFKLVELAIVIVIIGLLVGGILQGQELIRQAKFSSIVKEIEGYRAATNTLHAKYNCLPGDCVNSFTFFGNTCGTNNSINSVDTGCNGNGDKTLTTREGQLYWRHLVSGKMITGNYGNAYASIVGIGTSIPRSAYGENVGISAFYSQGNPAATTCGFQYCEGDINVRGGMLSRNVFNYGNSTGIEDFVRGAFLTPEENFLLDTKFDDGKYYSGRISGFNGVIASGSGRCGYNLPSTLYYNNDATYKDIVGCRLVFDMGS